MKTIVNIIDTQDPLPAYLFAKERYEEGDRLLFIAAYGQGWMVTHITRQLQMDSTIVHAAIMERPEDGHKYEHICRRVIPMLSKKMHYDVNLAGGTRYMCLSVQRLFEDYEASFFYIKTRENEIVASTFNNTLYDEDDVVSSIAYRMSLSEYLCLHGLKNDLSEKRHLPIRDRETVNCFFRAYCYGQLTGEDFKTLDALRIYYRDFRGTLNIHALKERGIGRRNPPLRGIYQLFQHCGFIPSHPQELNDAEVDYLTGGWFEQYVYYLVRDGVRPDDIAIGVHIARPYDNTGHDNELDVIFIRNNRLFVVECKSGISTERLFNEIVYKATALREALLGIACHSYIFSLKADDRDEHLYKIARHMDITFCDRHCLTSNAIVDVFHQMKAASQ